jgi:hypothetical protein
MKAPMKKFEMNKKMDKDSKMKESNPKEKKMDKMQMAKMSKKKY